MTSILQFLGLGLTFIIVYGLTSRAIKELKGATTVEIEDWVQPRAEAVLTISCVLGFFAILLSIF